MATAVVGSVTAELILDSKQFVSGLETAKEKIRGLSGNIGTGNLDALAKKVAEINSETQKVKENFSSLGKVQYGNPLKGWVEPIEEVVSGMNKINEEMNIQQEKLRLLNDEWMSFKSVYNGLLSTKPMDTWIKDIEKATIETKKYSAEVAKMGHVAKVGNTVRNYTDPMMTADYNSARQFFERIGMEATKSGEQVANFEKQIIALKNAISSGRQFTLLENANGVLTTTSEKVTKLRAELEQLYATMSMNSTRGVGSIGNSINQTSQQLSNLSRNITQTSSSFKNMSTASAGVVNSVNTMNGTFGGAVQNVRNVGTAYNTTSGVMTRYKDSANQASASTSRLGTSASTATSGMNNLSSSANRLQGALSSVKMMATALSSMFIWTFGMSLYEATKQTLESKNEMESYLHQMGMGRGAINLFNQGLDETADRFKKLNKYMIGETIASIGMEFDLTANQMKKSMEVVAMVQNEYVRAGRKEAEASLAVKDILQGEFLRLSRETGVGKADLEATGLWSGDLKDVEGLMDALKKVGEDRHWDLFASKCNSLNDVVNETKNRISEFGASLADQLSPAIVSGFNMIIEVIDKVTSTWNNFDPTQKFMVGIPAILAFGTALMMVAGNLSLLDIAQMGYTNSLLTMVLRLDVATVKEYGLATAITSKVTAMEASTVAEMGSIQALVTRVMGLDANIAKEFGLTSALAYSTFAKNVDTASMDANSIAKEFNAMTNLNLIQTLAYLVTGEEAVTVATWSTTESIWALVTSMVALEALAVIAIIAGIAVALGSLAMEAQRAKEAVDGFYDIVDNGDAYVDDAKKNIEGLGQQYDNLGNKIAEAKAKGEDTWQMEQTQARVKSNKEFAEAQLKDLEDVNQKAKKSAEEYQNSITNANYDFEKRNAKIFENLGHDTTKAGEYANQYAQQYEKGAKQMEIATNAYTSALDTGASHMEGQVDVLKNMGANQETLTQYTKEYGEEVLKNAEYQKEWAEGDFWAIFKIGLSDLKLAWIDFTYWIGQQGWWKDFCNAMGEVGNALGDVYHAIEPVIPVVWEFLKAIGSELWTRFVDACHLIYDGVKLVYPILREVAGITYENISKLVDDFKELYKVLKAINDFRNGDGSGLEEWLNHMGEKYPTPTTPEGNFDVLKWMGDKFREVDIGTIFPEMNIIGSIFPVPTIGDIQDQIGRIGDAINDGIYNYDWGSFLNNLSSGMSQHLNDIDIGEMLSQIDPAFNLIDMIFPMPTNEQLGAKFGEIFDLIKQYIWNGDWLNQGGAVFNNGSGEGGDTGGGFIDQLLQSWLGGDPLTTVSTAVNTYIVQPFVQGIQMGLASIPIVGDILAFLGLIDTTTPTASEKGGNIGRAIGDGIHNMILNIPIVGDILRILEMISGTNPTANSQGYGVGSNIKGGVDSGKAGTAQLVSSEMGEVISAVANAIGQAWSAAQQVGQAILNGINSVIEHHSPGIPAQLIGAEMMEIQLAMANSVDAIYQQAQEVGNAITTGIQPNTNVEFDAEAMAQYQADMMMAMGMASETVDGSESAFSQLDTTTATTFANIGNTVGTTMLNIANTTRLNYNNIALTTKTQLTNMQSQTTKNIGAIRQSWTGMQVALIASAEHIRSETGAKINSLQNNMASFWRKVQNPALLLGAGDSSEEHGGARHRRYTSNTSGVRKLLSPNGFAGSPHINRSNSNPRGARTGTGISDKIKNKSYQGINIFDALEQYLECKENGGNCFAGGWDFNWSDDIKQALLTWHTNFGEIYDPYLYVGKFENDDFPVRGVAPIAKNYIYDAISRTSYEYYFDSKYGSPLEAWNAGHFNCYDGALLVLALANAFGFSGYMKSGSWSGIPHVWAYVEGLGDIDATAIQGGYGFTSPKVAGHPTLDKRFKHNRSSSDDKDRGNTFNGDIHIHIDGTGKDTEEIGEEVRNVMVDLMSPNPATGI